MVFAAEISGVWGLIIYRQNGLENKFPMVYYMSQKI
jgi:hypothetical protein